MVTCFICFSAQAEAEYDGGEHVAQQNSSAHQGQEESVELEKHKGGMYKDRDRDLAIGRVKDKNVPFKCMFQKTASR